ncbi:hypothetical protein KM914_11710 [Virgibacillus pantothenticus]|nr:hypothetical protein [Virgibacillus pantothenticus]MBU8567093.1 hypothetical protein [Virgibacillus pantothenticus]MBU8600875.1 hypothetical protein [Virgibacillus pantothenticus]MBU8635245.1 hypothetical protein [Virgibacillus pantothenticus]MBU8642944.1 hypothetical protein [Virgibacillus pantothenticus]MBU8647035.1 hypothetical protein [Virgibacillus pantothenticus]
MDVFKLILIFLVIITFVFLMMTKRLSTIIALPSMGIIVALIGAAGEYPLLGLFDFETGKVDENGEAIVQGGIFNSVILNGVTMLAGAISAIVFAAAFAKILMKTGVIDTIIKRAAELAGDKPRVLAIVFYIACTIVFTAIGGIGSVVLIGTIVLPILLTAGIKPIHAAVIFLFGLSTGGILNPMNYATFIALLSPIYDGDSSRALQEIIQLSVPVFIIVFIISCIYILMNVPSNQTVRRAWPSELADKSNGKQVSIWAMLATIIPVVLILGGTFLDYPIPVEVALVIAIIYTLIVTKLKNPFQATTQAFVEGTKDIAGVIVLLIGLGILIQGFQYPPVLDIISQFVTKGVQFLQNPFSYVIGFTLLTVLTLYRGPLNTFGIGGSLPALFAASGFSPLAIIWVLRAAGNLQGFGDPTNSHNIWVADHVKVDVNDITKKVIPWGILMSFLILLYAVLFEGSTLGF